MSSATTAPVRRYERHSENQQERILSSAESLVDARGVDNPTMADFATAAGITRATLYRYYPNKDHVLWGIYNRKMESFARDMAEMDAESGTTYERLKRFLERLSKNYRENPESYRFFTQFYKVYQSATTEPGMETYRQMHGTGFGSGDTVRMLSKNFHDGSVRADLDPMVTVTSLVYVTLGLLSGVAGYKPGIVAKYHVDDLQVIDFYVDMFLSYVRA